ncbi:hypothetical protein [Marinimicrobium agarilyticum]|uniref:hypothetical protein n=1 Tax=Marinimicrobium agarilyticum TaxID=306546 RepID=UPI00040F5483|nr:hypothetical protein [Marinimicrobium agarilyticum]
MAKPQHLPRHNLELAPDAKGRLFFDKNQFCDLSEVNILHSGVDTVRQLYRGYLKTDLMERLEDYSGFMMLGGYEWVAGRIGRDSGYQYKLQNADLGLILLIKNFNVKIDNNGPHLKIEASPHLIDEHTPYELQGIMNDLANEVLDDFDFNQSAVHIAVDVQGWEPPSDIVARMHCRSNHVRQFDSMDSIEFASHSATYNRGQSYLFGTASGVQLAIYNKSIQAKAVDKLDYWESVWKRQDNPFEDAPYNYDPEKPVWRIELRYHHSVVQQFSEGTTMAGQPVVFKSYAGLAPHLDGLWKYGLDSFKFLHRPGFFHPFWTLLAQDVKVQTQVKSLLEKTDYKRYYKTSTGFSGKNIELLLGNAISLAARERLTIAQLLNALQTLPFWPTIKNFYQDKGMSQGEFYHHIEKLLKERYLRWGKAI